MAKTFGGFMKDIGKALGFGGGSGNASGAGGTTQSISGQVAAAMNPNKPSIIGGGGGDGPKPKPAPAPTPTPLPVAPPPTPAPTPTPTPPPAPPPVVPGSTTSTGAVEDAALESAQQGLASTIATGAQGLLAEEEPMGLLRRRRSLVGGGLIA